MVGDWGVWLPSQTRCEITSKGCSFVAPAHLWHGFYSAAMWRGAWTKRAAGATRGMGSYRYAHALLQAPRPRRRCDSLLVGRERAWQINVHVRGSVVRAGNTSYSKMAPLFQWKRGDDRGSRIAQWVSHGSSCVPYKHA